MPLVARCLCLKLVLIHVHHVQNKVITIVSMKVVVWVVVAAVTATNFFAVQIRLIFTDSASVIQIQIFKIALGCAVDLLIVVIEFLPNGNHALDDFVKNHIIICNYL